jgi:hypothetical protein
MHFTPEEDVGFDDRSDILCLRNPLLRGNLCALTFDGKIANSHVIPAEEPEHVLSSSVRSDGGHLHHSYGLPTGLASAQYVCHHVSGCLSGFRWSFVLSVIFAASSRPAGIFISL